MKPLHTLLALVCALGGAAAPARASTVSYHLNGRVTQVKGAAGPLGALGVQHDALVSIDWTIERTTPVHDTNPAVFSTSYWATTPANGITSFTVKIGSWTATGQSPTAPGTIDANVISVRDGPPSQPLDTLDLSRSSVDTNSLVTANDPNGSEIVLNLAAPDGGGSTSNALGEQDPAKYPASTGYVVGRTGVEVDFSIGGPDPTVKCRASQLASAGALCQSTLACLAAHAKAPAKDPNDVKLDACEQKAHDKFVAAFDKAAASAVRAGLACPTSEDGAAFAGDFATAADAVVSVVQSVNPQTPTVVSSWYSGAGAMCGAAAKAEAKNAAKPTTKLALLREKARLKLGTAAQAAVTKAEARGVAFDPEPDVAGLVESIDHLVDDAVAELAGP